MKNLTVVWMKGISYWRTYTLRHSKANIKSMAAFFHISSFAFQNYNRTFTTHFHLFCECEKNIINLIREFFFSVKISLYGK